MLYYYKLITKQDVTRSFVINRKAMDHFFGVKLLSHGDESIVMLKYESENYIETKILLHQDCRLLIQNRNMKIGEIAFFEKAEDGFFNLSIIKTRHSVDIVKSKMINNFYLSTKKINLYAN